MIVILLCLIINKIIKWPSGFESMFLFVQLDSIRAGGGKILNRIQMNAMKTLR